MPLLWRFPRRGRGAWYGLAIDVVAPLISLAVRWRVRGTGHVPRRGGVLVAANHVSDADPFLVTLFCLSAGRVPRFLAKEELWTTPVVRRVMISGRHIRVDRGKASALHAYRDAVARVRADECVVVFPEGTLTHRDDGWPMRANTGLARMALTTGVPVVPLACWGTGQLLPESARWPRLWPRPTVELAAGPPVDLADLVGDRPTATDLREATDRIMTSVTSLLADLRGETPPPEIRRA